MTAPPVPDTAEAAARRKRRRRWTLGGILSGLASLATILTLFITAGNNSTTSTPQYPANVQANYLNACEQNATVTACGCTLNWFETNVTLAQFQQDETTLEQSGQPDADMQDAISACQGG